MLGAPPLGARVKIWPMPGRNVQFGPRPVDRAGGGSWLPASGREITWDTFFQEQLQAGDLLLHPPPCEKHERAKDGEGKDSGDCLRCGRSPEECAKYDEHASAARGRAKLSAKLEEKRGLFDPAKAAEDEARALGLLSDEKPAEPKAEGKE